MFKLAPNIAFQNLIPLKKTTQFKEVQNQMYNSVSGELLRKKDAGGKHEEGVDNTKKYKRHNFKSLTLTPNGVKVIHCSYL